MAREATAWRRLTSSARVPLTARRSNCIAVSAICRKSPDEEGFQPLACYADSPWVQVVAGHSLDEAEAARQHQPLAEEAAVISYSALFGRLFELTVDVIYGVIHPRELIAFLDQHADQPEVPVFRPFVAIDALGASVVVGTHDFCVRISLVDSGGAKGLPDDQVLCRGL